MTADPGTRLRADARRNRDQIIAAAKLAFAEVGADVPLEEVARRAGVGIGTLYRRFADRDELVRAVATHTLGAVLDDIRAADAEEPDAWKVLVRVMGTSRDIRLAIRLVLHSPRSLDTITADPQLQRFRQELLAVLDCLVRDAQAQGTLRADVGTGDVAALMGLLVRRVPFDTEDLGEMAMERVLGLMLDGLRAAPPSALPGRPLSAEDLSGHIHRT